MEAASSGDSTHLSALHILIGRIDTKSSGPLRQKNFRIDRTPDTTAQKRPKKSPRNIPPGLNPSHDPSSHPSPMPDTSISAVVTPIEIKSNPVGGRDGPVGPDGLAASGRGSD
jgi:hypothetical protein